MTRLNHAHVQSTNAAGSTLAAFVFVFVPTPSHFRSGVCTTGITTGRNDIFDLR